MINSPEQLRNLVYILAPSYTGSTLLTFLLSTHKSIATIGELKASREYELDTYHCSCGFLLRECNFWKRVSEEMRKAGASFTLRHFGTHFRADSFLCDRLINVGVKGRSLDAIRNLMLGFLPGCRRQLHSILERNQQLIDVICDLQQGKVFLDGSKDPIRLELLHSAIYWSVKVIYLIRDGRGVTNSYMHHYNVPMEKASREWCRACRECDRVVQELGIDTYVTVHYEDLCREPQETMENIFTFLGLNPDLGELQFRSSEHHILGNPMRLASTTDITLDERWKTALTQEDLRVFEQTAGALNRSYGYNLV